jgi:hypothetical protein
VLESVEFVERVRRRVRRPLVLDLAAGHGLVGLLLAGAERGVRSRARGRRLVLASRPCYSWIALAWLDMDIKLDRPRTLCYFRINAGQDNVPAACLYVRLVDPVLAC